ncbi:MULTISPECIES: hypothetical protein [unclassified Lysinibacillus]|uniref:hypothetical protein n=1 Tax=unclassified Lysinibacillus TaxID=2636778 RepID=UPI0037F3F5B3
MPEINLPTKATQDAIKTNVDNVNTNVTSVKTDVATVKSNVATVDTNVKTVNTNLGTPTSSASSSTSGNAHAKLNWLMNNGSTKTVLKVSGLDANYASQSLTNQLGTIVPYSGDANLYLNVYGSGRLLYLINGTNHYALYVKIDGKSFSLGYEGIFDIPFSTSLRIEHGGSPDNAPRLIYYELNQ